MIRIDYFRGGTMGYRIVYSNDSQTDRKIGNDRRKWRIAVFAAAIFLTVSVFWPQSRDILLELWIPGDVESFQTGFVKFSDQLKNGSSVRDALMVFCREILAGAEIA